MSAGVEDDSGPFGAGACDAAVAMEKSSKV